MNILNKNHDGYFGMIGILLVTVIISVLFIKFYSSTHKESDIENTEQTNIQPLNGDGEISKTKNDRLHDDINAANDVINMVNKHNLDISNSN